jgi:O-antigen ligase
MRYSRKSANQTEVDITDYYAVKPKAIWQGLKQESPAFWWLCIYLFLEYIRPASLYPVLDVLPWTQIALLMVCITAYSDKTITWVRFKVNSLIVLFFIIVLLSSVFAFRPSVSWSKIDVPINWVIVYFLIITVVNTEKRIFIFVLLFLLVNFKMGQHGFFSFVNRGFTYTKWGVVGSPGWWRDSGDFGIAMTVFFPLATAFALALKEYWGRYKRWFFYFLPVTGVVTIIATSSRGAQVGMAAIGIWFLLKSAKGIKAMLGILIVGWALYSLLPEQMLEEYQSAGDDPTSRDRIYHWEFGREVVREFPVLGVGYNNWLDYCNFRNPYGLGIRSTCRMPHNTYIDAAAQLGWVGFLVYVWLALSIFIINLRTRKNARKYNNKLILYLAHGLDGGLVGYLVSTIFFSELFYPDFWVQLSMTVALSEVSKKLHPISESVTGPELSGDSSQVTPHTGLLNRRR